jgi:hypothetical protein
MSRLLLGNVLLAAVLAAGCGSDASGGDDGGPTPPSMPTPGTPATSCAPPSEPSNLRATSEDTRVTLTWSAVPGAVEYTTLIGSAPSTPNLVNENTTQTTYHWNGARVGTNYARVASTNACGATSTSRNEISFVVSSAN